MNRDEVVMETNFDGIMSPKRGKVRDIYDLGDKLLIVVTDRISAFDVIMNEGIPGKIGLHNNFVSIHIIRSSYSVYLIHYP